MSRLVQAVTVTGVVAAAIWTARNAEVLSEWLRGGAAMSLEGVAIFGAGFFVCTLLAVPGTLPNLIAGAVYGPWLGTLLCLSFGAIADLAAFFLARSVGRSAVAQRLQRWPALFTLDQALADDGTRVVALLRLSPLAPYSVLNYALGVTSVTAWSFTVGTAIGTLPTTLLFSLVGASAADGFARGGLADGSWIAPTVAGILTVASAFGLGWVARSSLRRYGAQR